MIDLRLNEFNRMDSKFKMPTMIAFFLQFLIVTFVAAYAEETAQIPISGFSHPNTKAIDSEILQFIEKHKVPGMSVAMTVNGELKYARGFGYADAGRKKSVKPESLFRIASLSKPITAVAILQLVENKQLKLDDKIVEVLGQLEEQQENIFDGRMNSVTIRHLLQHRGGWDRDQSFDPMFQTIRFAGLLKISPPVDSNQVISAMMRQPLDFPPGERYAYSNFGYCLLGRVIEDISELSYEEYVRQNVLAPLGITQMRIGRTLQTERAPNEVEYFHSKAGKSVFAANLGENVHSPYGAWYLEAMDAHGGWIASASDLVRFSSVFDNPDQCKVLKASSVKTMFERPKIGSDEKNNSPVYYSLGWQNRILPNGRANQWHTGSLPGTTAIMIRRNDGKNFVALLNTRESSSEDSLSRDLDQLLHRAANKVNNWPRGDLFESRKLEL